MRQILALFAFLILFVSISCTPPPETDSETIPELTLNTYYLVRHAEKELDQENPSLTAEGIQRAADLVDMMENIPLDAVYTTNYNRTIQTAQGVAAQKGLEFILYDPSDLPAFAEKLEADHAGQHILIVGHSNTTPALLNSLNPNSNLPSISEEEYDHFFILTMAGDKGQLSQIRYGN